MPDNHAMPDDRTTLNSRPTADNAPRPDNYHGTQQAIPSPQPTRTTANNNDPNPSPTQREAAMTTTDPTEPDLTPQHKAQLTTRLTSRLASLTTTAPEHLRDRVIARWTRQPSLIGDVDIAYTDRGVAYLRPSALGTLASEFRSRFGRPLIHTNHPPSALIDALATSDSSALSFDLTGLTPFQTSVLRTALTIPKGHIHPYGWIASRIDNPRAVRAVGTALGHNPIPLLIPCHRVVKADCTSGQYIFGIDTKIALLRHEGVTVT